MGRCSVLGCNGRAVHMFPKDPEARKLWELAIQTKSNVQSRLCQNHFRKSDYVDAVQCSRPGQQKRRNILKKGVVPSVFPWSHKSDNEDVLEISDDEIQCSEEQTQADSTPHVEDNDTVPKFCLVEIPDTGYDQCRCCLVEGKHSQIEGRIDFKIFKDCLNLSPLSDPRLPQLMCSSCVSFLKEVKAFREMVTESQRYLLENITNGTAQAEESSHSSSDIEEQTSIVKTEVNDELDSKFAYSENVTDTLHISADEDSSQSSSDIEEQKSIVKTEVNDELDPIFVHSDNVTETVNETAKAEESSHSSSDTEEQTSIVKTEANNELNTRFSYSEYVTDIDNELAGALESFRKKSDAEEQISIVKTEVNDDQETTFAHSENIPETVNESGFIVKVRNEIEESILSTPTIENTFSMSEIFTHEIRNEESNDQTESMLKRKNYDSESEIPISQIKDKHKKKRAGRIDKDYITIDGIHKVASDETKIRANIILLLQHSTILPFRNNIKHTFKCFYCNESCRIFKDLKEHTESGHKDHISDTAILTLLIKRDHKIITADISSIKCRLCNEQNKSIENLIEHLINVHKKEYYDTVTKPSHGIVGFELSTKTLRCHQCNKSFSFFKNLSEHMNVHYDLFLCYYCGKKFISEHRYDFHVLNKHENSFTCERCGEIYKSKVAMQNHKKKIHTHKLICSECSETFQIDQSRRRKQHMKEVHGIL